VGAGVGLARDEDDRRIVAADLMSDVLVNAEDPGVRARRYALVRGTAGVLARVADFERITEGGAR
jgi:glycyl-tRNA synthetase beta subunit